MVSVDSKSGARFERVVIDGYAFVLKHVDRHDDWITRQTGDVGCGPVLAWEAGVARPRAATCIDHTIVGAARRPAGRGPHARRGRGLVPAGDVPLPLEQHLRFLDHLAAFHAGALGLGRHRSACPVGEPLLLLRARRARLRTRRSASRSRSPGLAADGWLRLESVAPCSPRRLRPLRDAPWPLFDAFAEHPIAFLHGDTKLANLGIASRRAHRARRLVAVGRRAAARRGRALARVEQRALPGRARQGRHRRRVPCRASNAAASTPADGATVSSRCASSA